jgi:hypothetical protein
MMPQSTRPGGQLPPGLQFGHSGPQSLRGLRQAARLALRPLGSPDRPAVGDGLAGLVIHGGGRLISLDPILRDD